MSAAPWLFALLIGLVGLLGGEATGRTSLRVPAKILASSAFVGLAWSQGSLLGPGGGWLTGALILCWLGDVLLLGRSRRAFLLGLLAFLLGHAAFIGAFARWGLAIRVAAAAALVLALPAGLVFRWLRPHLPGPMVGPVIAYTIVITAMVAGAVGNFAAGGPPRILLAALMFYVSDLAVARNRFVAPGVANRMWGLPLYYGAMALLAGGA